MNCGVPALAQGVVLIFVYSVGNVKSACVYKSSSIGVLAIMHSLMRTLEVRAVLGN